MLVILVPFVLLFHICDTEGSPKTSSFSRADGVAPTTSFVGLFSLCILLPPCGENQTSRSCGAIGCGRQNRCPSPRSFSNRRARYNRHEVMQGRFESRAASREAHPMRSGTFPVSQLDTARHGGATPHGGRVGPTPTVVAAPRRQPARPLQWTFFSVVWTKATPPLCGTRSDSPRLSGAQAAAGMAPSFLPRSFLSRRTLSASLPVPPTPPRQRLSRLPACVSTLPARVSILPVLVSILPAC